MLYKQGGSEALMFITTNGSAYSSVNSGIVPGTNEWYHVVAIRDESSISIWVDGILTHVDDTHGMQFSNQPIKFGDSNVGESYPANAIIDEVGLWNRTLSSTEITQLYNSGNGLAVFATPEPSANVGTEETQE
ncbi:MAG: hypothetical protein NTZ78_06085 [Candidatus Aureabacteria bacterium]|nr:hypothetical protein [Candidatus Auribacterota bacterium]